MAGDQEKSDDNVEEQWIVESDYLHPKGSSPERAVCIPIEPEKIKDRRSSFSIFRSSNKSHRLSNWSEDLLQIDMKI